MHRFAPRLVAVSSFLISLLLVIASLFVVSLFAGGSSAAPAAGNGNGAATGGGPINVTDCEYLDIFDETTCYTARGDYHFVSTPSGSYQAHYEAHHCFTVYPGTNTSAAPLSQLCGYDHNQFHTSQGEAQVVQDAYGESYTDAAGNSFCYAAQYHEVNGVVQYDRFSTTCKGNAATPVA